jgi:hypothetical protein
MQKICFDSRLTELIFITYLFNIVVILFYSTSVNNGLAVLIKQLFPYKPIRKRNLPEDATDITNDQENQLNNYLQSKLILTY